MHRRINDALVLAFCYLILYKLLTMMMASLLGPVTEALRNVGR